MSVSLLWLKDHTRDATHVIPTGNYVIAAVGNYVIENPSDLGKFMIADTAQVPRFSTHTTRHLCLTDLARMGWELHAIATFAGHQSTETTLRYIHLSGRELSSQLNRSMAHVHAERVRMLTESTGTQA